MAQPTIDLADNIATWVSTFNTLSANIGDPNNLLTALDSNLVAGINSLIGQAGIDSAATQTVARESVTVTDNGGFGGLSYNNSTGVISYTGPESTDIRPLFSASKASGYGDLSYNSSTGAFTFTGVSDTEIRGRFSAGEGLDYNSTTGEISAELATTSNRGVASFNTNRFTVTSGAVDIKTGSITSSYFSNTSTLTIYDENGTVLKTIVGAGS